MAQRDDSGLCGWRVFFDGDDGVEELAGDALLPPRGLLLAVPSTAPFATHASTVTALTPPDGAVWIDVSGVAAWDASLRPRLTVADHPFAPAASQRHPGQLLEALRARYLPTLDLPREMADAFGALCGMRLYLEAGVHLGLRRLGERPDLNRLATWEVRTLVNEVLERAYRVVRFDGGAVEPDLWAAYQALGEMDEQIEVAMSSGCTVAEVLRYGEAASQHPPLRPLHRHPDDPTLQTRGDVTARKPHVVWSWCEFEIDERDDETFTMAGPSIDSVWPTEQAALQRAREISVVESHDLYPSQHAHIRTSVLLEGGGPEESVTFERGVAWVVHTVRAAALTPADLTASPPYLNLSILTAGVYPTLAEAERARDALLPVTGPAAEILAGVGRALLAEPSVVNSSDAHVRLHGAAHWMSTREHTVGCHRVVAVAARTALPPAQRAQGVELLLRGDGAHARTSFVTAVPLCDPDRHLVGVPPPALPPQLPSDAAADLFMAIFPDLAGDFDGVLAVLREVMEE